MEYNAGMRNINEKLINSIWSSMNMNILISYKMQSDSEY